MEPRRDGVRLHAYFWQSNMKIIKYSLLGISLSVLLLAIACKPAAARSCAYDPNSGKPNPLGMRAFITLTEQAGNTIVVFEQFPSPVGNAQNVTIANRRELIFYGRNINQARQLLLQNKEYYSELVGYEDPEGFQPINEVLTCQ